MRHVLVLFIFLVFTHSFSSSYNYYENIAFSLPGGIYKSKQSLELSGSNNIYYTTDSREPTLDASDRFGVQVEYFENQNFENTRITRKLDYIHWNWAEMSPDPGIIKRDSFSVRFSGKLIAPHAGNTKLLISSSDPVKLFIDGIQYLSTSGGEFPYILTTTLGQEFDFQLDFIETDTNAFVSLKWQYGDKDLHVIPKEFFRTSPSTIKYKDPILLDKSTVIKAAILDSDETSYYYGYLNSISQSYIIEDRDIDLPIVSIITDPKNLFSNESGTYTIGFNALDWKPYYYGNYWDTEEQECEMEFFLVNGQSAFKQKLGFRNYGGWSRHLPQKSLAFFAREQYGNGNLNYPLFKNRHMTKYESFILRNSGNDWNETMFRDAAIGSTVDTTGIDVQAYQPTVVYINGEYWGIMNLREKVNEHFIADNNGLKSEDSVQIMEASISQDRYISVDGNTDVEEEFEALIQYIDKNAITRQPVYDLVKSKIDIPNFITYQMIQIFYANGDWPGNNSKFWKSPRHDNKWRYIVYDVDYGMKDWKSDKNTFAAATSLDNPEHPNPYWATFLLYQLMKNPDFKNLFINTFADHLNTTFHPQRTLPILDSIQNIVSNEIHHHHLRWGGSQELYQEKYESFLFYMQNRYDKLWFIMQDHFGLQNTIEIEASTPHTNRGFIQINTLSVKDSSWSGKYFKNHPIKISAAPYEGYVFSHWSGDINTSNQTVEFFPLDNSNITAHFLPVSEATSANTEKIVIHEINYNPSKNKFSDEWIELYNHSDHDVDLSDWILKDAKNYQQFKFPSGAIIPSRQTLIVSKDPLSFLETYPDEPRPFGPYDFSLSNSSDSIRLFDKYGTLRDIVVYTDSGPWPLEADGQGETLELISPDLDNSLPSSWKASKYLGTPHSSLAAPAPITLPYDPEFTLTVPTPMITPIISKKITTHEKTKPYLSSSIVGLEDIPESTQWIKIYNLQGNLLKTLSNSKQQINLGLLNLAQAIVFLRFE